MQEFFAKTTEDFAEDSLLNLDDDTTNNFAVYKDNVIILSEDESGTNALSYDSSTNTYTVENPDEVASAMQAGDIFVYNHDSTNAVIVKIASISIDGTTAKITGADTAIEEVFEYVRIEATGENGNYTEDASTLDPDLTPYPQTYNLRRGVDITASETVSEKFELNSELGNNCKITGTLTFGLTASARVYVSPSYSYAEIKFDYSIGATLTFEGEASKDYKLKGYNIPLAAGAVIISITPTVKFESSVNVTCSGTLSGTVGACVATGTGYRSLNKDPEFKPELKAEGKIYMGVSLEAKVSVLVCVVQASVSGELGVEIEGKLCGEITFEDNEAHDCKACIDGDINAKVKVTLSIGLLELDALTYKKPFEYTTKISDFYYSLTYNEFAFTSCPHLRYKVTVVVNDKNNCPVESALVNSNYYTNSNGVATLKLQNGTYNISAKHNDLTASQQITVKDSATTVILTLGGSNNTGNNGNNNNGFVSNGDIVSVATGWVHSAAVTKDGTLYMWGANNNYCLGDNITTTAHSPIKVSGSNSVIPENSVKAVSLGYQHTAVILTDGSLYTWGYNNCGQLGNGNAGSTYLPQKIMNNVKSVSLGHSHSAAITTDGSLYMWGNNNSGQLGNDGTGNAYLPQKIMDNVKSVSLGENHSAVITEDGVLYVWGYGSRGQIGNNTYSDNYRAHIETSPVKIMENVASVSLGNNHSAAITTDGNLYVWGYNYYGEIGDGTTSRRTYPTKIANNIARVSLGSSTTFAITNDGALYGWSLNANGQLGNGTTNNIATPQKLMSDVVMVSPSVTGSHTAILTSDGSVYTCGANAQGQLGNGTTDNRYTPDKIEVYDHTPYLTAAVNNTSVSTYGVLRAAAGSRRTATFNGLMANAAYNFYSIKTKKAENVMSSENLLYVDQVTADQNGSITISYYPDEEYSTPFEFVANLTRINMQNTEISVPQYYYNGTEQHFNPVIKFGEYTLIEGIDYEFDGISKATASGEYMVNICGKGNYVGKITASFVINKVSVANLKVDGLGEIQYSGNALTPQLTVTEGNRTLVKDTDYTVEYQNNINLGIGIAVIKGIDNYTGRQVCWFDIVERELTAEMITLNKKQLYTGQVVTPEITICNGENTLTQNIDYTVELKNNVEIGTACAVITGKGNYTGCVEVEFEICEGVFGDADRDCDINVNDVTTIQLHLAKLAELSDIELKYCDVDGDESVTVNDATYIQLYLVGLFEMQTQ